MGSSSRLSGLRSSIWFIPVMCVLGGVVLSIATLGADRAFGFELIPQWVTGDPDAARAILETVAASMVSLAALVLTITMVVVQLAMGQFSPRIVQNFLRDKPSQFSVGLFVATFAYAMISLREVQSDGDGQVPGIAILVAYVLVLTSIAMLVIYVHHIGRSLRVSALIELVGNDTRRLLDEHYPDAGQPGEADPGVILSPRSGVVTSYDADRLIELAVASGCVLHVIPALGSYVPAGAPLIRIEGEPSSIDRRAAASALGMGLERTMEQDLAYGFRMLVDMAERSLSESPFLDPTTAVQCIDRIHDGLRQLGVRVIPDGRFCDGSGRLRVTTPAMGWDAYVHLGFDEIRLAGARSPQVSRRLAAALEDLLDVVPPERRPVLREQLELLRDGVRDVGRAAPDEVRALTPDGQGIGTGPTDGHARSRVRIS
jgi:uncharacterized membrane protein